MYKEAWIDFTDFGFDGYLPISTHEMGLLLAGAQDMLDEHQPEHVAVMMDRLAGQLWLDALEDRITGTWITKAAMLIAMRGLKGEKIPSIKYWRD
jgi:hypothetical protein